MKTCFPCHLQAKAGDLVFTHHAPEERVRSKAAMKKGCRIVAYRAISDESAVKASLTPIPRPSLLDSLLGECAT